jgi:glycosyltransferase involved in cell wall biosynthesis
MADSDDNAGATALVTVYIPSRNYGEFLDKAIASVRDQLHRNWELIVVDDASTDQTAAVAEQARRQDPARIRVIRFDEPRGLQQIANHVLKVASGRYLVRLDADDWLDESALLLMVAKLESDPRLGIVYGNYFYTDREGRVLGMERRRKLGEEDEAQHLPPHGACTMVRTRLLKAVGGYSEDVDAQDGWELWYKLANRTVAANLEAPLFYYRQHDQSLSRDAGRLLEARARILAKARSRLEDSYVPSCLAVIPVRESYPKFEGVPYREVGGRSLLQRALESALGARAVTETAVSSDSERVLEFARDLGARGIVGRHLQVARPAALTGSHIRLREILLHAAEAHRDAHGAAPDIVVFLNLHAPMRRASHIDKALDTLRITACDSVVSVCEEREPVFRHGRDGLELLNPGRFDELTYERERLYRFNGAVLATWWEILAGGDVFGRNVGYVEMDEHDSLQVKRASDLGRLAAALDGDPSG